jgi:lysophospholipase L1-like esterase
MARVAPRVLLATAALALGACGSDDPSPSTVTASGSAPATLVAALGDSITAGTPLFDPAFPDQGDERSQWGYWAGRRLAGTTFRNCGVAGDRTEQIAARLENCARGADVLVIQGGINDIAQGRPVEAIARDLRDMIRRGKELGLRVATVELLPWNNGYPAAAPLIDRLNRRIRAVGLREKVPVFPWYRALEDPAAPGRMRPELTSDGDHPSIAGYRLLGGLVDLPE